MTDFNEGSTPPSLNGSAQQIEAALRAWASKVPTIAEVIDERCRADHVERGSWLVEFLEGSDVHPLWITATILQALLHGVDRGWFEVSAVFEDEHGEQRREMKTDNETGTYEGSQVQLSSEDGWFFIEDLLHGERWSKQP